MITINDQIAAKKAELDKLRPITGDSLAMLKQIYDLDLTYTSTAIEGNSLTRIETANLLGFGHSWSGKSEHDHEEVLGHQEALDYVHQLAQENKGILEVEIRQIHSLVTGRTDPEYAGQYSPHDRTIRGTSIELPSPIDISPLMRDFGQWLSKAPSSVETAFTAHERLVMIHPFTDGNGRTARLLMNLVLFKAGYPPVVIGPEHQMGYTKVIKALQEGEDADESYHRFMIGRLDASLDHHLSFLRKGLKPAGNTSSQKVDEDASSPKPGGGGYSR
ncbi:MAG TPA: Fic family protein [Candidatus Baltobacteraceae bacterium]|jgi:Fic family protein|nr:Fic family protein [Candidatus Baltobacteraceae bacterium]